MTEINRSYNVHNHYKNLTVEELKAVSDEDRLNYSVCLLNLEHDLNIGNCIRSAHLLGAKKVYILGKRKYDSRSTVGSNNYIDIEKYKVEDIEDHNEVKSVFNTMVEDNNLYPIFIDKTDSSHSLDEFKNLPMDDKHYCLVLGNEGAGIPDNLLEMDYPCYHIEQRGVIRSLNVSSAASIVFHEFSKLF